MDATAWRRSLNSAGSSLTSAERSSIVAALFCSFKRSQRRSRSSTVVWRSTDFIVFGSSLIRPVTARS